MDFLAFTNFNPWCKTPTPLPNKGLHSTAVVLGRPGLKAMQPTLSMDTLSCVVATLAGSTVAIVKKTKKRPYIVRRAKDVPPPDQRAQPDEKKLMSSQSGSKNTCSACGSCNAEVGSSRRHFSVVAGLVAPSLGINQAAFAEKVTFSKTQCLYCGGIGTVTCNSCNGSGNLQMQGVRNGNAEASYMFTECPICEGVGDEICARCFGSGLPNKSLKGFLKDPAFQKAVYYMRVFKKKHDAETLKKLQVEARAAAIVVANRKAGKIEVASVA